MARRFDMSQVSNIPRLSHRLNTMPIKIPTGFLKELNKPIRRFIWKNKDPRIAKTFLKKKNKVRRPALPDIKNYYKV